MFIIKHKYLFTKNNRIHSVHTWFKTNLHPPIANFTQFQNRVYYSKIKTVNKLPHEIKDLANETIQFQNVFIEVSAYKLF
jgi:hypothetical protein